MYDVEVYNLELFQRIIKPIPYVRASNRTVVIVTVCLKIPPLTILSKECYEKKKKSGSSSKCTLFISNISCYLELFGVLNKYLDSLASN